jgi:hypothetical protein
VLHLLLDEHIKFHGAVPQHRSAGVRVIGALYGGMRTVTSAWMMHPISEGSQMKELPLNSGTSDRKPFLILDHL